MEPEIETLSDASAPASPNDLVLALDGFEGPIDLLLNLAREQKVDLGKIAILPLAEQYLTYIAEVRRLRLEVAADYLVMAAWLAFLKSRLLLPEPPQAKDETDPAAMAEALKFQLLRLEAMQKAAKDIQALPQLGVDIFLRGISEPVEVEEKPIWFLTIQDLMTAISAPSRRRKPATYSIAPLHLFTLEDSVRRLRRMLGIGNIPNWSSLQGFLPEVADPEQVLEARSALASTFAATLELVKSGEMELRQDGVFAPIYMRKRETPPDEDPAETTDTVKSDDQ